MMRLPLRTVHPRKACAAVTESIVCTPVHILGQRPAQRAQFNLEQRSKHQQHGFTFTEAVSSNILRTEEFTHYGSTDWCFSLKEREREREACGEPPVSSSITISIKINS